MRRATYDIPHQDLRQLRSVSETPASPTGPLAWREGSSCLMAPRSSRTAGAAGGTRSPSRRHRRPHNPDGTVIERLQTFALALRPRMRRPLMPKGCPSPEQKNGQHHERRSCDRSPRRGPCRIGPLLRCWREANCRSIARSPVGFTAAGRFTPRSGRERAISRRCLRVRNAEALLIRQALTGRLLDGAAGTVSEQVAPESDVHASATYRRQMARVVARRALGAAAARVTNGGARLA
jgi:CO dehydrogenase flavoprotein subunit